MSGAALARVEARGARIAQARAHERREAMVARVERDHPGLSAHIDGDAVVIEGRHLLDRWLRDARLRDIGRAGL